MLSMKDFPFSYQLHCDGNILSRERIKNVTQRSIDVGWTSSRVKIVID
ncbi:unnamed protein product [Arabidopsis halleri]